MHLSRSLEITEISEIGLLFEVLVLSPFLKTGTRLVYFYSGETSPEDSEVLNKSAIGVRRLSVLLMGLVGVWLP